MIALAGQLREFPLAELLFFLSNKRRSGWLRITSSGGALTFTLRRGRVVAAEAPTVEHRLGQRLIRDGYLKADDLTAALDFQLHQAGSHSALGSVLVRRGILSVGDVQRALREQIREVLFQVMISTGSRFEFRAGLPDLDVIELDLQIEHEVLEALHRADEWIAAQIEHARVRVAANLTPDMLEELILLDWPILDALMDDATAFDAIILHTGLSPAAVRQSLVRLQAADIIWLDLPPTPTAEQLTLTGIPAVAAD